MAHRHKRDTVIFELPRRRVVFAMADGRCQNCGAPLEGDWRIDYVVPLAKGGEHSYANARALCVTCHGPPGTQATGK